MPRMVIDSERRIWTRDLGRNLFTVFVFVRVPAPTMAITASVEYISASANRFNHTAAASSSSLVAFGSGKFVALWDAQVSFPLVGAVV
jgi:hypothetical protein